MRNNTCNKHKKNPVTIYNPCVGCELEYLNNKIEELKNIADNPNFENFIRAFWRRIETYKQDFERELPEELPVKFQASMETALLALKLK